MSLRLPEFEVRSKGGFPRLEFDLLNDGTVYVEAESDEERVTNYLERADVERLRAWCVEALKLGECGAD